MTYQVDAIYDTGVFRPLQPLALPDQSRVTITITEAKTVVEGSLPAKADEAAVVARQRQAAQELMESLAEQQGEELAEKKIPTLYDRLKDVIGSVDDLPEDLDNRDLVARQRQAALELDDELANIPDLSPDDGFSSTDHDRILYGSPQ
jgi:predicted DNA-binding antitoxin AbrB/MazE fold protein